MNLSLTLVGLWVLMANAPAIFPSNDHQRARAYLLTTLGIPLLGFVTYQNGPWIGMAALLTGMSMLRWPARKLWVWCREAFAFGIRRRDVASEKEV